jgi:hypothetical protein
MTRIAKIATSAVVATALLVGQLATSATAHAGSYRSRGFDRHYGYHAPAPRPYYGYRHQAPRRDRSGDAVAGVVLGLGALIVGAAIADAARNKRRHYDYDHD